MLAAMALTAMAPQSASADTAPSPGEPVTVTADALPTWQTDGVVWSIAMVGNTVYVGGNFEHIRPPGTNRGDPQETPRQNLAAFNATTGEPLPWSPEAEGVPFTSTNPQNGCDNLGNNQWNCDAVRELKASPDGSRLYIGGDFTKINGQARRRIAAFNLPDGTLNSFSHDLNNAVRALAVSDTSVYAGGYFTTVDGVTRQRLAAFDTATGALTAWAPTADRGVHAMVVSPDGSRVVLGGYFNQINGNPPHGLGAVHTDATGTSAPWATGVDYISDSRQSHVTDLVIDNDTVYASAEGAGTFDGRLALNPDDGELRWVDNCRGATQALTPLGGVLYSGSHAHDCSTQPEGFPELTGHPAQRLLAEPTKPTTHTPAILHWFPNTNNGTGPDHQGPRALDNNGQYLWVGGEFTAVNNQAQQGLTRFGTLAVTTDTDKPASPTKPTVSKPADTTGTVKIDWTQTWDRDNKNLKYELLRDNTVIHTAESPSRFWNLQSMTYTDTGLPNGSTHTYSIRAIDPFGNRIWSPQSDPIQIS